jgi:hypothetical protein
MAKKKKPAVTGEPSASDSLVTHTQGTPSNALRDFESGQAGVESPILAWRDLPTYIAFAPTATRRRALQVWLGAPDYYSSKSAGPLVAHHNRDSVVGVATNIFCRCVLPHHVCHDVGRAITSEQHAGCAPRMEKRCGLRAMRTSSCTCIGAIGMSQIWAVSDARSATPLQMLGHLRNEHYHEGYTMA